MTKDRLLSIILIVIIVATIALLGYTISNPYKGDPFTEFYILGQEGQADNYPGEIVLGDSATVILGIVNHEQGVARYRVEIKAFDELIGSLDWITLPDEQKYEKEIAFSPLVAGENQKIEFLLYLGGSTNPYLSLHLYVDVISSNS